MTQSMEIPLDCSDADYLSQVRYALSFAAKDIERYELGADANLRIWLKPDVDPGSVRTKVEKLLGRYSKTQFGLKSVVHFEQRRDLRRSDVWSQLLERRWVSPVGTGHVILRGRAAELQRVIDAKILEAFAGPFGAEEEFYPSTILCRTLDRMHHFTSFPEHVDFVAHVESDVDVLEAFSARCRDEGWQPAHHVGIMGSVEYAITPSCCYHCYEGMEGWDLEKPGRCVTVVLGCHRYEGGNLHSMSRLRAFTMRELVWVGHPEYVKASRTDADRRIVEWAKAWEFDCVFDNANDMFFTDDYAVKASFQRQQEGKRELRLLIPQEDKRISVFSSNFHSNTFGKAFNIKVGGRIATSACVGWGYERWVYAVFSQFGLDPGGWPKGLREDFERLAPRRA